MQIDERHIRLLMSRHSNHVEMERIMSASASEGRTLTEEEAATFDALTRDVQEADLLMAYLRATRVSKPPAPPQQPAVRSPSWHPTPPSSSHQHARYVKSHVSSPRPMDLCHCTLAGGELLRGRSILDPTPFSEMEPTPTFGSARH
jgi:hypothetical protein